MKCFKCKAEISKAVRTCVDGKFRDLCEVCYPKHMETQGFVRVSDSPIPHYVKS
jgi:hypothetical protein